MANQGKSSKITWMGFLVLFIVWIITFFFLYNERRETDVLTSEYVRLLKENKGLQKQNKDLQTRYDFAIGKFRETIKSASIILAKSGLELPEKCGAGNNLEVDDEHHMLQTIQDLLECLDSAMELSEDIKESLVADLTDVQIELFEVQTRLRLITKSLEKCETMVEDGTHVYKKATCKRWRGSAFRWKNQVQALEEQVETLKKENEALINNQKPRAPVSPVAPVDVQENGSTGRSR